MIRCRDLVPALLVLVGVAPVFAQSCEKEWWVASNGLQPLGGVLVPICMTEYDPDGPGPLPNHLYVAGHFRFENSIGNSFGIARWDGIAWTGVQNGLGGGGFDAVYDLVSYDPDGDGPAAPLLIAGGAFYTASGVSLSGLAAWNGQTWNHLGGGVTNYVFRNVYALAVHDFDGPGPQPPRLIVGGSFSINGAAFSPSIAVWDGTSWSELDDPSLNLPAIDLASVDLDGAGPELPQLFANMDEIRRWDGAQWISTGRGSLELGFHSRFQFVDVDGPGPIPPRIYSINEANVAFWHNDAWVVLPGSPGGHILSSWDEDGTGVRHLIAVGDYEIHQYDGANWTLIAYPPGFFRASNGAFWACYPFDPDGPGPLHETLFVSEEIVASRPSDSGGLGRYGCAIEWARCFADANQDSRVSMPDLTAVLRDWGSGNPITDVNQDRVVGTIDLTAILHTWGEDCLPEETSQRTAAIDRSAISDPQFLELLDAKDAGDMARITELLANWDHGSQP